MRYVVTIKRDETFCITPNDVAEILRKELGKDGFTVEAYCDDMRAAEEERYCNLLDAIQKFEENVREDALPFLTDDEYYCPWYDDHNGTRFNLEVCRNPQYGKEFATIVENAVRAEGMKRGIPREHIERILKMREYGKIIRI